MTIGGSKIMEEQGADAPVADAQLEEIAFEVKHLFWFAWNLNTLLIRHGPLPIDSIKLGQETFDDIIKAFGELGIHLTPPPPENSI